LLAARAGKFRQANPRSAHMLRTIRPTLTNTAQARS
jgi:hypothetical protein